MSNADVSVRGENSSLPATVLHFSAINVKAKMRALTKKVVHRLFPPAFAKATAWQARLFAQLPPTFRLRSAYVPTSFRLRSDFGVTSRRDRPARLYTALTRIFGRFKVLFCSNSESGSQENGISYRRKRSAGDAPSPSFGVAGTPASKACHSSLVTRHFSCLPREV